MSNEGTYKEIFDVVGDARDPAGIDPRARGVAPGHDFTKAATGNPLIWCEVNGLVMPQTVDVYAGPGDVDPHIQMVCPACIARGRSPDQAGLTIRHSQKPFSYERSARVPPFPGFSEADMERARQARPANSWGLLTIEKPIACTWEETPDARRSFGLSRCNWKVQIVNNVAKDIR